MTRKLQKLNIAFNFFFLDRIFFLLKNRNVDQIFFRFGYKTNKFTFRLKPYDSDSDDEDYNVDFVDESKLPPIEIPPSDHKLQSCYNLW